MRLEPEPVGFVDRASLKAAVDEWVANEPRARAKHGDIAGWDVSLVTDMYGLFMGAEAFDGDLSQWNVANVTDLSYMFNGASASAFENPVMRSVHAWENAHKRIAGQQLIFETFCIAIPLK